jgi:hypothetical protein
MQREHLKHFEHKAFGYSLNTCPQCTADNSRRFAQVTKFRHQDVPKDVRHEYLAWVRPRLEAIRTGTNGGDTVEARRWERNFIAALHNRITSHMPNQGGRKYAPDYAKYHLATYGNDYRYLHAL